MEEEELIFPAFFKFSGFISLFLENKSKLFLWLYEYNLRDRSVFKKWLQASAFDFTARVEQLFGLTAQKLSVSAQWQSCSAEPALWVPGFHWPSGAECVP